MAQCQQDRQARLDCGDRSEHARRKKLSKTNFRYYAKLSNRRNEWHFESFFAVGLTASNGQSFVSTSSLVLSINSCSTEMKTTLWCSPVATTLLSLSLAVTCALLPGCKDSSIPSTIADEDAISDYLQEHPESQNPKEPEQPPPGTPI